jgi:hypothetical protein
MLHVLTGAERGEHLPQIGDTVGRATVHSHFVAAIVAIGIAGSGPAWVDKHERIIPPITIQIPTLRMARLEQFALELLIGAHENSEWSNGKLVIDANHGPIHLLQAAFYAVKLEVQRRDVVVCCR